MHQTIKIIFRFCFALVIFLITFALFFTCFSKVKEIYQAEHTLSHAQSLILKSTPQQQLVLLSNNKKPDQTIFIVIANNGYIIKIDCDHYINEICTDQYNQSHTRQIKSLQLLKVGQHQYIQNIVYQDSRTSKITELNFDQTQIKTFYQTDISNLKYIIFIIALFAVAALYVSLRIAKNFKHFLKS